MESSGTVLYIIEREKEREYCCLIPGGVCIREKAFVQAVVVVGWKDDGL